MLKKCCVCNENTDSFKSTEHAVSYSEATTQFCVAYLEFLYILTRTHGHTNLKCSNTVVYFVCMKNVNI